MANHPNRNKTPRERIAPHIDAIYLALETAAGFMEGFEGDETQEDGVPVEEVRKAKELVFPLSSWGRAAAAGWEHGGDAGGFWFHKPTWGSWKSAASWEGHRSEEPRGRGMRPRTYATVQELCLEERL